MTENLKLKTLDELREYVASRLQGYRLEHSLETEKLACKIADKFGGADPAKAAIAGLLHDIARDMEGSVLLQEAMHKGIMVREVDRRCPVLLHGRVAAIKVKDELGIYDPEILQAISSHVTGRRGWNMLEKIVYLADKIEPTRRYAGVDEIRAVLHQGDFAGALIKALHSAVSYARCSNQGVVDPETVVVLSEESEALTRESVARDRRD